VGLDTGATFAAGTQQVVSTDLSGRLGRNECHDPHCVYQSAFPAGISDVNANPLPASFLAGSLAIPATPLEGHVALSANEGYAVDTRTGSGRTVRGGLGTWIILTNAAEFQQADCAPRATLGDGSIDVARLGAGGPLRARLGPPTARRAVGQRLRRRRPGSVKANLSKGVKSAPQTGSRTISHRPG